MSSFVVTTSIAGISRSQIWSGTAPMTVGSPLRWVIEKTPQGVRARDLFGRANQVRKDAIHEIDAASLISGTVLKLPLSRDNRSLCELRIRPIRRAAAPYGGRSGEQLNIFTGFGASITAAQSFAGEYIGKNGKESLFSLKKSASGYDLTILKEGLRTDAASLKAGETLHYSADQLLKLRLSLSSRTWQFGLLPDPALVSGPESAKKAIPRAEEDLWFGKAMRNGAIVFAAFVAITLLWPKPKPSEELIPEQFTKIVMSRPSTKSEPAAAGDSAPAQKATTVEKAAVVQAFRAKALQKSINGLLKGGLTLLSQSDLVVGGKATGKARSLFNSKSGVLGATGAEAGLMNSGNVQVGAIGGSGGTGKVGYGKGGGAAIAGQGNSLVSLDLGSANVEDGLSKEEVGEVIHRHMSEVRYCYESAMLRTPGIEGRLIVNFTIGGSGSVRSSEVKSSTLPDPRLDDCILRRLATWKFPNTKGGIDVAVSYPFIFKTLGR